MIPLGGGERKWRKYGQIGSKDVPADEKKHVRYLA